MNWIYLSVSVIAAALGAGTQPSWQPLGQTDAVSLDGGQAVRLQADQPVTAGALSSPIRLPSRADALLVRLRIEGADPQAVTLAVHDAATGDPIAYWQNTTTIGEPTVDAAALVFARPASEVRLFVGTHDQASSAHVEVLAIQPLRAAESFGQMLYGGSLWAKDQPTKQSIGQSFTARGDRFAGMTFMVRFGKSVANEAPPDVIAKLYRWQDSPAATRAGEPLAQTRVSSSVIPVGKRMIDNFVMFPLPADVQPHEKYYVELTLAETWSQASADEAGSEWRFLANGAPEGFPGGTLYQDDHDTEWDVATTIFYEEHE